MIRYLANRVVFEYDSSGRKLMELFPDQFMYGAREQMFEYAGLSMDRILIGVLQHGVGPTFSLYNTHPAPRKGLQRSKIWVSSPSAEKELRLSGVQKVTSIGSAWSYMMKNHGLSASNKNQKLRDILFFPRHFGGGINPYQYNLHDARILCKSLRDRYKKESITICIFHADLFALNWAELASHFDIDIVSAGIGTTYPPWYPSKSRINFLNQTAEIILTHKQCFFEGFSSALIYAISLNREVQIINLPGTARPNYNVREDEWLLENLPRVFKSPINDSLCKELAADLLGEDAVREPQELQELLLTKHIPILDFYRDLKIY